MRFPEVACNTTTGLRVAAGAELARLRNAELRTEDSTYKVSLEKRATEIM